MSTVAAVAGVGESGPLPGPVSPADLARTGERRLRIRHQSRRRREGPLAVARAIPPGHRRARTVAGWLDDVAQHPAMLLRRGDAQRGILAVARELSRRAAWPRPELGEEDLAAMLVWPTWAVLIERTGLSRSTVAAHLAWLRRAGLLGLVSGGTTAQFSPAILADGSEGNSAAVYVLCAPVRLRLVAVAHPDDVGAEHLHDGRDLPTDPATDAPREDVVIDLATGEVLTPDQLPDQPGAPAAAPAGREDDAHPTRRLPVDRTQTPTGPRRGPVSPTYTRESANRIGAGLRPALNTPSPMCQVPHQDTPDSPPWPLGSTPPREKNQRLDRLAAAAAMQAALPLLRRISAAHVAHLCREWWLAGWTPADILTALGRRPDRTPWTLSDDVRHVPGWFRHRLAAWRTDPTNPASPITRAPSARAAAAAAHARAAARARSERLATDQALVTGADHALVRAHADTARAAHRAAYTGRHSRRT
ncbi:MAG TPA: helix-turn-helix domain-containing protein [Kineosporiaceae bacterium]